jgi:hypothetical protein
MITISGIAIAAVSSGHKLVKSQPGLNTMANINVIGKVTEATIEASEMYRHIKTVTTHAAKAKTEQIV